MKCEELVTHAQIGAKVLFEDGGLGVVKKLIVGDRETWSNENKVILLINFHGTDFNERAMGYWDDFSAVIISEKDYNRRLKNGN